MLNSASSVAEPSYPKTLILDAAYRPIGVINWVGAICLLLKEKGEILESYEQSIRSVQIQFKLPAVIKVPYLDERKKVVLSKRNIFTRDNYRCTYCNRRYRMAELSIDHVIPTSLGGKNTWDNLVTACLTCNRKKDNRTPQQAGMLMYNQPVRPDWRADFVTHQEINALWRRWIFEPATTP